MSYQSKWMQCMQYHGVQGPGKKWLQVQLLNALIIIKNSSDIEETEIEQKMISNLLEKACDAGIEVDMSGEKYVGADECIPTEWQHIWEDSLETSCTEM